MAAKNPIDRPAPQSPKSLSGLIPFLKPYRLQIGLALVFLVFYYPIHLQKEKQLMLLLPLEQKHLFY